MGKERPNSEDVRQRSTTTLYNKREHVSMSQAGAGGGGDMYTARWRDGDKGTLWSINNKKCEESVKTS